MNDETIKKIQQIEDDIRSIKIQGATNVALAVVEGMRIVDEAGCDEEEILSTGRKLSNVRLNEPLARNAVKYIQYYMASGKDITTIIENYRNLVKVSKEKIIEYGGELLCKYKVILTHCHSSTSTAILIRAFDKNNKIKVVSTETRPRYQGRITAKELVDAGVDVTQIVDSVSGSFIVDDTYLPVDAVIIGTDELLANGTVINKVGSFQMALAAKMGKDDFFVATSLLKLDPNRDTEVPKIEMRSAKEVWEEAPEGLKIINPAFEAIPQEYITGYITEIGVLKSADLLSEAKKTYPWL